MLPDDPFQAASITKMVTATIFMTFVEKGKVDLDAGIGRYLPAQVTSRPQGAVFPGCGRWRRSSRRSCESWIFTLESRRNERVGKVDRGALAGLGRDEH
jgi:hypothetical protein